MAHKSSNMRKSHHEQRKFSYSRPRYREARWERAIKVYTINLESKYLLIQGVPSVGATKELLELCALYGAVEEYRILEDYPAEPFTKVYWIKFQKINAARVAKKKLDNKSFFGGVLHVCYAPEYEKMEDTREKLQERRKVIARKCKEYYGVQSQANAVERRDNNKQNQNSQASQEEKEQSHSTEQQDLTSVQQQSQAQADARNSRGGAWHASSTSTVPTDGSQYGSWGYYDFPQLPPPPVPLHPTHLPPPPPPSWDLPRVPTAHATLPPYLQNLPLPPPPPPPPPPQSTMSPTPASTLVTSCTRSQKAFGEVTSTASSSVTTAWCEPPSALSSMRGSAAAAPQNLLLEIKSSTWQKGLHREPDINVSSIPLPLNPVPIRVYGPTATSPSVTGNTSMDMTVLAVRNKMKVRTEQNSTTPSAKKKKRKRI